MGDFSFSTIPLGLGLSSAAHFYFCQKTLARAEQDRRRHACLSENSQLDIWVQSFSDQALVSELIELLDNTLLSGSTTRSGCRRTACFGIGLDGNAIASCPGPGTRSLLCGQNSTRIRPQHEGCSTLEDTVNKKKVGSGLRERGALTSDRHDANQTPLQRSSNQSNGNDSPQYQHGHAVANDHPKSQSHCRSGVETVDISLEQIQLWIKACRELRRTQERGLQKTLAQMNINRNSRLHHSGRSQDGPMVGVLKTNALVSLLLGTATTASYLVYQTQASSFSLPLLPLLPLTPSSCAQSSTSRSWSWSSFLLSLFSSPSLSSLPALSEPSLSSSCHPTKALLLPLAPTVLISGIHLFAALRTRWALDRIKQTTSGQTVFIKRTRNLVRSLKLREQRLGYLFERLRSHDRIRPRSLESLQEGGDEHECGQASLSSPTSSVQPPPQPPVQSSTSRCTLTPICASDTNDSDNNGSEVSDDDSDSVNHHRGSDRISTSGSGMHAARLIGASSLTTTMRMSTAALTRLMGLDETGFTAESHLQFLNLDMLVRDPIERSRVLRFELEALRKDLATFCAESC